jgi:hypothetical protein
MSAPAEFTKPGRPFTFSVFCKELAERANRPRTYGFRLVILALLFFTVIASVLLDQRSINLQLGIGGTIFDTLIKIQFAAIYLFVTASLVQRGGSKW